MQLLSNMRKKYHLSDDDIDTMKLYAKATVSSKSLKIRDLHTAYQETFDPSISMRERQNRRDLIFNIIYRYVYRVTVREYAHFLEKHPDKQNTISFADLITLCCEYLFNRSEISQRLMNLEKGVAYSSAVQTITVSSKIYVRKMIDYKLSRTAYIADPYALDPPEDEWAFERQLVDFLTHEKIVTSFVIPAAKRMGEKYHRVLTEDLSIDEPTSIEIGKKMNVTKNRICEMRSRLVKRSIKAILFSLTHRERRMDTDDMNVSVLAI